MNTGVATAKTSGVPLTKEDCGANDESLPLVSVVMPVRNEAAHIAKTLQAVLAQDYPREKMEIIVADGMSTDDTRRIIASLQDDNSHLRLISNPGKIVPTGLNAAIRRAQGEIIVRLDGHTEVATDYVRQCVGSLLRTGADNAGGRMSAVGGGFVGRAIAIATSTPLGVGSARFHYSDKEEWVDTVYLGAWRKDLFRRLGLFDEEQVRNQDDEFNYRLLKHGGRILLTPAVKSRYTVRSSLHKLCSQYFQYGFWKVRVMQKHPRQMQWRQFAPPGMVALFIALLIGAVWFPWSRIAALTATGTYLIAVLVASLSAGRKAGWRSAVLLPVVFATLHVSYGVGFVAGLFKFWNRWKDREGQVPPFEFPLPKGYR